MQNCTFNLQLLLRPQFKRKQWASCGLSHSDIYLAQICAALSMEKSCIAMVKSHSYARKKLSIEHVHLRRRPLRACPHFNLWHTHRLCIVQMETRPQGSERCRGTASTACDQPSSACALVVCDLGLGSPAVLWDAGEGPISSTRQ